MPTAANVMHYARIVRDKAILRSLITTATGIAARGYEASSDVKELLDRAEQEIFAISDREVRPSFVRIDSLLHATFKTIEKLHEQQAGGDRRPDGLRRPRRA